MIRQELYDRKERYLTKRTEIDHNLTDIREQLENIREQVTEYIAERDTAQERLARIKELANGLGTVPSLTKLREFLATIKELINDK